MGLEKKVTLWKDHPSRKTTVKLDFKARGGGGSGVKKTSCAHLIEFFPLISELFQKCENSKYFSKYSAKRRAKMVSGGGQTRLKRGPKWP